MALIDALLLAASITLSHGSQAVRIAPDSWPSVTPVSAIETLQPGERVWWWSDRCVPVKVTAERPQAQCGAGVTRTLRVVDERGKPVAAAKVVWGTAEMLSDVPEPMLPSLNVNDDGTAAALLPNTIVYVRAAAPSAASWWQRVAASTAPVVVRAWEGRSVRTSIQLPAGVARRSTIEVEPAAIASAASDVRSWTVTENAELTLLPLPAMTLKYTAWCDDGAPFTATVTTATFPRTLTLAAGGRADGRIVDRAGRGIRGAAIEAVFKLPDASRGLRRRAVSDAAGHFIFRGLAAGSIQLLVRKNGYATAMRLMNGSEASRLDDIVLSPARSVELRVTDSANRPVSGAELRTESGAHAATGSNGVASLNDVPAGEDVGVTVRARGFHNRAVTIPAATSRAMSVVLSRGVSVTATLRRADTRELAAGGTMLVINNGGRRVERFEGGTIDVGGLEPGTLSLEIRADRTQPFVVQERAVAADDVVDLGELLLPAGRAIRGRVIARQSGAPAANVHVRALRRSNFGPIGAFAMRDWSEAATNEDGAFEIGGVDPGPQVLLIEGGGFASRLITADIAEDSLDLGVVDLDRGRELVVECAPSRRCGSEARLLFGGAEFPWASVVGTMRDGTAHVFAAPSGPATLRLLSSGHVIDERPVEVSSQSDLTRVQIKLLSTTVSGTVTSAGRPREGGLVQLERESAGAAVMPVFVESRTAEGQTAGSGWLTDMPSVLTSGVSADGRFQFEDVPAGRYTATYRHNGAVAASLRVDVPENEQFTFALDVAPGELQGSVADDRGRPVRLASIEVRDALGEPHLTQTDVAGEFAVSGIAPGRASVRAMSADGEGNSEAEIVPPKTATVKVTLQPKDQKSWAVAVSDPRGQPLAGAMVFLLGSGGLPAGIATSDTAGMATFRLSQPLTTPLAAYHSSYGWSWTASRTIGGDEGGCNIRMSAATGSVVIGAQSAATVGVFTSSGVPLSSAFCFLGVPMTAAPGNDLRFSGLPPGTYMLQAGTFRASAEVQAGKDARVSIR